MAASGRLSHIGLRSWQQLLLLTFGGGMVVGVLCLWLLATMYLVHSALLAVPVIAGLAVLLVVGLLPGTEPARRPDVEDLVRAMRELREAELAARRAHARDEPADVTRRDPAIG